jgi:hypothetical protein
MTGRKLRNRLAGAASLAVAVTAVTMTLGAGAAFATPGDPAGGATPVAPNFNNGNVETIRGAGSDTSFFLEQRISDLYNGAGLYGCTLNSGAGQTLYNTSDPASATGNEEFFCQANANTATSDVTDNWNRTEVLQGVDDIGGTAGQEQLCGNLATPAPVDYSRSAKPPLATSAGGCATEAQLGFAKDGLPAVDFPTVNPSVYGTTSPTGVYSGINGGNVGPVANGWLPGDPTAGPYSGTAFTALSNADGTGPGGATSTAYRIWCASGSTRISDWGALTNLGPKLAIVDVTTTSSSATVSLSGGAPEGTSFPASIVNGDTVSGPGIQSGTTVSTNGGTTLTLSKTATASSTTATLDITVASAVVVGQGIPDGVPIRVVGINTAAGVEATFSSYANSGLGSGGGCSANMNTNAANDPNPSTAPSPNSAHIALQNNASQIADYAVGDFPSDAVDQAIEIATSLYMESNGVYNTTPFASSAEITSGATTTSYTAVKLSENGKTTTTPNLLNNIYPTAFTLSNIYRTDTVRASTAGFLNWICDSNTDFAKGQDNSTGKNYDTELTTLIDGTYGFVRLTDNSAAPSTATPADGVAAANTTCASGTVVVGGVTEGNGVPGVTAVANPQT